MSLPTEPLQILLALCGLASFAAATFVWHMGARMTWAVVPTFLVVEGVLRACAESVRDPMAGGRAFPSMAQALAIGMVCAGAVVAGSEKGYVWARHRDGLCGGGWIKVG